MREIEAIRDGVLASLRDAMTKTYEEATADLAAAERTRMIAALRADPGVLSVEPDSNDPASILINRRSGPASLRQVRLRDGQPTE